MDSPFLSTIFPWPVSWAPYMYAFCWGQQLTAQQNSALFSLIGATYGGNQVNFNLPDLRSRMIIGAAQSSVPNLTMRALASKGGQEGVGLNANYLPAHTHGATFTPAGGGSGSSTTISIATGQGDTQTPQSGQSYYLAAPAVTDPSGGGAEPNVAPYLHNTGTAPTSTATLAGVTGGGGSGSGGTVTIAPGGGVSSNQQPVPTLPPYIALNFIMAIQGLYPSRD